MQVHLTALPKTQSAISTQMISHGNVWLLFSCTLRSLFGGLIAVSEHDETAMTQDSGERLRKSKLVLTCHSHRYKGYILPRQKNHKTKVLGSIL